MFDSVAPGRPSWGADFKRQLATYTRSMVLAGHGTSLPLESNDITLDPELVDAWGRPSA